jgi:hypothetical protein
MLEVGDIKFFVFSLDIEDLGNLRLVCEGTYVIRLTHQYLYLLQYKQ